MNSSVIFSQMGVAVGAISGTLEARSKQMDIFGATTVAVVTALGGGTLRDLLLQHGPVFWVHDVMPLIVAISAALITFVAASSPGKSARNALLIADAGALALFTVVGTEKALAAHVAPIVALVMGVITGVAGGIFRDILCNVIPMVLRRDIYATACIAGGALYLAMHAAGMPQEVVSVSTIITIFVIRIVVLRWKLSLPEALQPAQILAEQVRDQDRRN